MNPRVMPAEGRFDLAWIAFAAGLLFFCALGRAPLANPDEGRYAEIPREMVASGDWITPRLNGVAYFEKPPLVYWCVACALTLFGPSERVVRAVPALFAIGGVVLTYAATRRIFNRSAGIWAAVALGTSVFYFAIGRLLLIDMAVSVLISATLYCFIVGVLEPAGPRRRALFYGLYASAALATLAKGLIGFLLPGGVMFLWLLLFGQWKRLRPLYLPSGLLLFFALAGPWHALAATRNPDWARFYFVHEHWERFTTTTHGRFRPWWFFLPLIALGLFPWAGFLPQAVRTGFRAGWRAGKRLADASFFIVWAGFILLFFSVSNSKLPPYILPVFPPLAVLIGRGIAEGLSQGGRMRAGAIGFALGGVLLAAVCSLAIVRPDIAHLDTDQARSLRTPALVMAGVLVAGASAAIILAWRERAGAMLRTMGATAVCFLVTLACATRDIQPSGTKDLALFVKANVPADASVFHYHDFFHDFPFYAERFVGTVEFHGDELELVNDPIARRSGRFLNEDEFRVRWLSREHVFVVVRKEKLEEIRAAFLERSDSRQSKPPVLIEPQCGLHQVRETGHYYLFSNYRG